MSILRVNGGRSLYGSIRVHGAKNSVLPIMAASIIRSGESLIHNCPNLSDVDAAIKILEHLGCRVSHEGHTVYIDSSTMYRSDIPDALMREMRSSVIFLGAILARTGEATLSMPGGCELGARPIDLHLSSLRALGAEIFEHGGNIYCRRGAGRGAEINLRIPSVGATENAMLAACACKGTTVLTNCAQEPEIVDLQNFLVKLGAKISGAGSSTIIIDGISEAPPVEHRVIGDRIVAATYLSAAASAGGKVRVTDIDASHIDTVITSLREAGCEIEIGENSVEIVSRGSLKAMKPVITRPYPGFPTDAQPPIMAVSLRAAGTTVFVENIFENRYRHAEELRRMGADIRVEDRVAVVCGVKQLHAASVKATDLRGGAALVVAALTAEGQSDISGLNHIDRGYDGIETALSELGADIIRV